MRDLMRSYKLKLQRKVSASDSDAESQPLTSSMSTNASFGTLNDHNIMFTHDSDMTDVEVEQAALKKRKCDDTNSSSTSTTLTSGAFLRSPFCHVAQHDADDGDYRYQRLIVDAATAGGREEEEEEEEVDGPTAIYDRFEYFYKGGAKSCRTDAFLPQKLMSFKDFKDIEKEEREQHGKDEPTQSSLVTIFAIWNTIMGSSLLAISWGLEKAGLFPGIVLILLIAAICLYTAYVILKVNESYGIYRNNEVPDLCRLLLGRWAEVIAKIFSLIVLIGANIVYWILMSNFLYNSVTFIYDYSFGVEEIEAELTPENSTVIAVICPKERNHSLSGLTAHAPSTFDSYWDLYSTVPVFLCFLMFPLLNFKSPTFFTKFNSLGTISVAYLVVLVVTKGFMWGVHVPDWLFEWNIKSNFSALSGMLSLSFFIHNIIISICKNNRHQENNGRDLSIAFILVTFTYLVVGVVFYISFPLTKNCIEDNILNNFPKYDAMAIVARILLLFQLFTVFPLISFMLRVNILNNLKAMFGNHKLGEFTYCRVIILNVVVVIVCTLFACFLPHIGTLIRYTGALSGMVYIFTLPNLLKIAALKRENALNAFNFCFHVSIICIGAANLALQFFIQDS